MFKRKIESEFIEWKKDLSIKRRALLVKGLRQVGKTTSLLDFAHKNYENVIYFNFKIQPELKAIFEGSLAIETLIMKISAAFPKNNLVPYKTVLFFDEVQECSGARASVKSFMEDDKFDVVESGSLLGIKGYNKKYHGGVPVGFEHTIYMKPLDFEEFLWSKGVSTTNIEFVKKCYYSKIHIDDFINEKFHEYFKEYLIVGGMPAVVDIFLKTSNIKEARIEQKNILEGFKDDYGKHLDENEKEKVDLELLGKINQVYDSIPSQLSKENKKFMVSKMNRSSSLASYETAIQWLLDYGLISKCFNVENIDLPLEGNKIPDCFKLYVNDTGLFMAMLDDTVCNDVLLNNLGIYKGAIYENIVAEAFIKKEKKLFYFSKNSGLEIDFLIENVDFVSLIEVKATNGNSKSLKTVLSNKKKYANVKDGIKLVNGNVGYLHNILTIPHYLSFLL